MELHFGIKKFLLLRQLLVGLESDFFLRGKFDNFLESLDLDLQFYIFSVQGLLFFEVGLVLCYLSVHFSQLCFWLVDNIAQGLVILFELDQSLHQELFVRWHFAIGLKVRLVILVLLLLQQGDSFVEFAYFLFHTKYFCLVIVSDFLQIYLLYFLPLFLIQFLKKLALAL